MTAKYIDFRESMTKELIDFIQSQAGALSVADLDQLISDLPALRERFARLPLQTYTHLPDQLEFLSLFVEEQISGRSCDLAEEPVAEAAFALLYFQRATDLIPDSIPDMGLLDDAMIVSMVLRRQERAFKRSSHAYMLRWPETKFEVDQLLSVISPLRVTSFCSSSSIQPPA
ncbi:MAG TPA: YkvA family protein [Chthoniobacterales bacterium]|nr:YkvA family protein [Chthoniobacterales bacterium]